MSREKVELLQRLSDFCTSSSKIEEVLQAKAVDLRRAMREAIDSFATDKKDLEETAQVSLFAFLSCWWCSLSLMTPLF